MKDRKDYQEFYDGKYAEGYKEAWPEWKHRRIEELIRSTLACDEIKKVLDFGTGRGVFLNTLKKVFPEATFYATDISEPFLKEVREQHPDVKVYHWERDFSELSKEKVDFIFSHHVLEHVWDLEEELRKVYEVLKGGGYFFAILPCGNPGSFEYRLCLMMRDGFREGKEGRLFYFEDPSHLRRITSKELIDRAGSVGFQIIESWFANQFWGSIEWLIPTDKKFFSSMFFRRTQGLSQQLVLLGVFIWIRVLKFFTRIPWVLNGIQKLREREWEKRKKDPCGSEMYLLFQKK